MPCVFVEAVASSICVTNHIRILKSKYFLCSVNSISHIHHIVFPLQYWQYFHHIPHLTVIKLPRHQWCQIIPEVFPADVCGEDNSLNVYFKTTCVNSTCVVAWQRCSALDGKSKLRCIRTPRYENSRTSGSEIHLIKLITFNLNLDKCIRTPRYENSRTSGSEFDSMY